MPDPVYLQNELSLKGEAQLCSLGLYSHRYPEQLGPRRDTRTSRGEGAKDTSCRTPDRAERAESKVDL